MCRNIKPLYHFDPPAGDEEIRAAALQFVRKVSGFGNFVLRDKRKRQGRNPQTGDPIVITERRVLSFKASQLLKQALNPKNGAED